MTEQLDTRSGLRFGFVRGVSGWGADLNTNFQILAYRGTHINIKQSRVETPPTNPTEGDCYSVGPNPTGAWSLFAENTLVVYGHTSVGGSLAWLNILPLIGWIAYDETTSNVVAFDGTSWGASTTSGSLPTTQRTFAEIATGLNALTGVEQVDYDSLKNTPTTITSAQALKITQSITTVTTDGTTASGDGTTTRPVAVINPFTAVLKTKLDGIEANASADQTATEIRDLLQTLLGTNRLDAAYIQGLPAGTTSSETGATIKAKLESLIGSNPDVRLIYGAIKGGPPATAEANVQADFAESDTASDAYIHNKPTIPSVETGTTIKTKLEALSIGPPDERLDASAIKNLPTSGGGTAETGLTIKTKLEGLVGVNKLLYSAIQGGPSLNSLTEVATESPIEGDGKASSPVKLDADTLTKLGKLTTSQPSFGTIANYQGDYNETNPNSFNFIRNKPTTTSTGGITSIRIGSTLIGNGISSDINVAIPFTNALRTKLQAIESNATADQTATEIRDLLQTLSGTARLDASYIKGIPTASGEANVQSSWLVTDTSSDAYIIGKPTIPSDLTTKLTKLDSFAINRQLPAGGTRGQHLAKSSDDNYAVRWINPPTAESTLEQSLGDTNSLIKELLVDLGASNTNTLTLSDRAQVLNNVSTFVDGEFKVFEIEDADDTYDPIFIEDERILSLTNSAAGSTLNDFTSRELTVYLDGEPTENKIRIGYDGNDRPLISKTSDATFRITVAVRAVTRKGDVTPVTDAHIRDVIGGMVSGNTETLITVTYANNKLNFIADVQSGTGGSGLTTVAHGGP